MSDSAMPKPSGTIGKNYACEQKHAHYGKGENPCPPCGPVMTLQVDIDPSTSRVCDCNCQILTSHFAPMEPSEPARMC